MPHASEAAALAAAASNIQCPASALAAHTFTATPPERMGRAGNA
jgi:hypothetical protein